MARDGFSAVGEMVSEEKFNKIFNKSSKAKETEVKKHELDIYYNSVYAFHCLCEQSELYIKNTGIEAERRSWVNGDYVEEIEEEIEKLKAENEKLKNLSRYILKNFLYGDEKRAFLKELKLQGIELEGDNE